MTCLPAFHFNLDAFCNQSASVRWCCCSEKRESAVERKKNSVSLAAKIHEKSSMVNILGAPCCVIMPSDMIFTSDERKRLVDGFVDLDSAGPKEPETMVVQIPEGAQAGDELTITTSNGQDTRNIFILVPVCHSVVNLCQVVVKLCGVDPNG